ncbi:MAG TPA: SURF1 family protein [Micromonosporaceae bacterium]|nr:SURF1 family protein [Micromonosporaceae bacterium]
MYRFLTTPKWLGFAALMVALSAIMVGLGFWQLDRYHIRHGMNVGIDHANATAPVPIGNVISPTRPATSAQEWTRITVRGTYEPDQTIVARDRSVNSTVGFEILVPLRLADGSTILVDRGWIPTGSGNGLTAPPFAGVPSGTVTVTGRIHLPESKGETPIELGGQTTVRRIDPRMIAPAAGLTDSYADYLLLDKQNPPAAAGFTRIPADRQPSWLNAGYTVQWWLFAALTLALFGWAARRQAHDLRDGVVRTRGDRTSRPRDRLADERYMRERFADERYMRDRFSDERPARGRFAEEGSIRGRLAEDGSARDRLADDPLDDRDATVAAAPPDVTAKPLV